MKGEDMAEFEITERTEPFTLDEVFSFIDDTNISKINAHELKSRIVDMVQAERNKAIDEFLEALKEEYKPLDETEADMCRMVFKRFDKIAEQLKGGAK
jgi:hypothetical protein